MDHDAGKVYEAERCLHVQGHPSRLTDPQAYHDDLVNSLWFRNRWQWLTDLGIEVRQTKHACAWSLLDKGLIYLPPWASCDLVLIHEVAHFLTWDTSDHNLTFRQNYLQLVKRCMGHESWFTLKHAFLAFGLEV